MPLLTTTPIRISTPIQAMSEKVVPVNRKNHQTPMMAKRIDDQMAPGNMSDSNSPAITKYMSASAIKVFTIMVLAVSSSKLNDEPKLQLYPAGS